jgi:hypothetical protein
VSLGANAGRTGEGRMRVGLARHRTSPAATGS